MKMPGIGGLKTLKRAKKIDPEIEVIMLTGQATIDSAVESMKMGGFKDVISRKLDRNGAEL